MSVLRFCHVSFVDVRHFGNEKLDGLLKVKAMTSLLDKIFVATLPSGHRFLNSYIEICLLLIFYYNMVFL